jgi:hypothetical protein
MSTPSQPDTQATVTWEPATSFVGGHLLDAIDVSYQELVDIFGPPHCDGDGYKVDAEWQLYVNGIGCTIYNYKTGPNYNDGEGEVADIRDWHIGGEDDRVALDVKRIIFEHQRKAAADNVDSTTERPVVFRMIRHNDESGVSGTGHVLSGVVWPNGWVNTFWNTATKPSSIGFYTDFESFMSIHVSSHPGNKTVIEWDDGREA